MSRSCSEAADLAGDELQVCWLGRRPYVETMAAQQAFTDGRHGETRDEIWWLEHDPVFTQGQAGRAEHVLAPGSIAVVQSDRGGQVTYHGPGQLVGYLLIDVRRRQLGVRALVTAIENAIIATLAGWGIEAAARADAPGVYVGDAKIASLGLRVRRGCSYHGLALNVDMDLEPFSRINPCGMAGLAVAQLADLGAETNMTVVRETLTAALVRELGYGEAC
ncbi:MAG: lipoyl(octanoyl) transferase LipB [Gammaproteobacteria bacterium]|nr:lipoyl(octanoyl) transferase LipB [Gammaproteobacteria bacterium]